MASVTVSKAVKTSVHFIDKGTKVGASYYRETLQQRCLLPEIRQTSGDHFVFQQDSAPSYQAKSTVEFVQRTVPNFTEPSVWPHNSPDFIVTRLTKLYGGSTAEHVLHSDFRFGRSQEQSAHLLGES